MSRELYIVPCGSAFPRYEEDDDGNRIPKDPDPPHPPRRWGSPSTRYRNDVLVVAPSGEVAIERAHADERVGEPLGIDPYIPEYLGDV